MSRNEKLYRLLLTAWDDGTPFWGVVQELILLNHWDTIDVSISVGEEKSRCLTTIQKAQELTWDLLQRDLVYINRTRGWPPPSSDIAVVTKAEWSKIIADNQNWIGPLEKGPFAVYFSICSTIPGASITRESVLPSRAASGY